MELIHEYLIKICIAVFTLTILMELYILFLFVKRSPKIFKKTYNDTINRYEEKSIEMTRKIEQYISNLLNRYTSDLKLIGKHELFYNGNTGKALNKDANLFNNYKNNKKIIFAKLENLKEENFTKNFFNESSQVLEYINKYEEEFKDFYHNNDRNSILNSLFSESHKELDTIGYYSYSKNEAVLSEDEEKNAKYLISILKTIFIRRYIIKRKNMDYIRFYIINKDEIYIYPTESYNNTHLFNFDQEHTFIGCNFSHGTKEQQFPLCIYNYIIGNLTQKDKNYVTMIHERVYYEKMFLSLCLKFPFVVNNPSQAIICIEIDFSTIFNNANFKFPEKYEFGIFTCEGNFIIPLLYCRKDLYDYIKSIFKNIGIQKFKIDETINYPIYSLFHFLYYNFSQIIQNHTEIKVNLTEIEEEYNIIYQKIISEIEQYKKLKELEKFSFNFNKSICRKSLLGNSYECIKDEYEMVIFPLLFRFYNLDNNFLEMKDDLNKNNFNFYIYSMISTNPFINKQKINTILKIKVQRTIILFFFFTLVIVCFLIFLINLLSEYSLLPINNVISELKKAEINNNLKNTNIIPEDKILAPNTEMSELKIIYETMRKIIIIKQIFDKEYFIDKHSLEFFNLIQDIKNKDVREICNSFIGFYHFKNNSYNLAETEFRNTILYIQENENKIIQGKNTDYDDKIRDDIKRSSTVSYINEYSIFEKIDENVLAIIKMKILKQRFLYLYALVKYKLGKEVNNSNQNTNITNNAGTAAATNKIKIKKNKDKKNNYFKESIKYFNDCKNINIALGINQIKIIYSLIMISKCYIQLNDYKNAINNISEALNAYFELSKSFKDYHSKNYNPKIMIFIENNIFQFIIYTIQRLCFIFNKPYASNWIILKIFETSPFLINNVHFHSGCFIQSYLDKNKLKFNKADKKILTNTFLMKEFEKTKKFFSKSISRMSVKNIYNKNNMQGKERMIGDSSYSTSHKNKTESKTDKSNFSSTFKKETATGKINSTFHLKNKNLNKIITLCLSEKILKKVNGLELKDVIIKYFQKYFDINKNDKFSFIQFANNGKKTIYFKQEKLDYFLEKIQKTKNCFELLDIYTTNINLPFMGLYNIFDFIIKNYPPQEDNITDNIIIMFINSEDIRFTSVNECLNIVEELNKKNASVFLLSYDIEIHMEKINNIQSFLNGLIEGYFFQIKNYQQIKQIFINISTKNYQSNFFGYDFNCNDHEL